MRRIPMGHLPGFVIMVIDVSQTAQLGRIYDNFLEGYKHHCPYVAIIFPF